MTTANVQVGAGMSYAGLSENHYEKEKQDSITREQSNYDFLIHEHVILNKTAFSELQEKQQKMIEKRDQKYRDRREYKKIDGTIEKYYQRKNDNPKVKYKQSNNFPVILTCGNIKDYDDFANYFEDFGLSENDIRKAHVTGLKNAVQDINNLGINGLMIDEYYMHANEKGVPHIHGRMLLDSVDGHGNPSGNFGKVLKDHYGEKYIKNAMEKFREDTDKIIMNNVGIELVKTVKDIEMTKENEAKLLSYTELTRTEGHIFESQQGYINDELRKDLEDKTIQFDEIAKKQATKEKQLANETKILFDKTTEINQRQINMDKKENQLNETAKKQATKENELVIAQQRIDKLSASINQRKRALEEEEKEKEKERIRKKNELQAKEKELESEEKRVRQELRQEKLELHFSVLDSVEESINVYDPSGSEYVDYASNHGLGLIDKNNNKRIPTNHYRAYEINQLKSAASESEDKAENRLSKFIDNVGNAVRELPDKLKELTNRVLEKSVGKHIDKRIDDYFERNAEPRKEDVKTAIDEDTKDILFQIFGQEQQIIEKNTSNHQKTNQPSNEFDLW